MRTGSTRTVDRTTNAATVGAGRIDDGVGGRSRSGHSRSDHGSRGRNGAVEPTGTHDATGGLGR
ncbi:hypothetical protein C487_12526 [Natrinema pallidum DSM 3751]|uniref:Uncharacterized protein n=2 Tax=Natrinema pallidum TaxID=69527 RepID=L9YPF6_9EURY|nr:hypothetical protein C487_12526 [Natrinema pallidum DSM 3751]QCW02790.1 hypothetical protein FGF80_05875 [Natrinema pallidum]